MTHKTAVFSEKAQFWGLIVISMILTTTTNASIQADSDELSTKFSENRFLKIVTEYENNDNTPRRSKRQIITSVLWTNKTIPYFINHNTTDVFKALFPIGINYISSRTCLKFVNDSQRTAKSRVELIESKSQCMAELGMRGRPQNMWLSQWCFLMPGLVVHEMMHTLGILHTHERYDRDEYLIINTTVWGTAKLFPNNSLNAVPFDYGSVMMYPVYAYGSGQLEPTNRDYRLTMGNFRVSFYDMLMINRAYNCSCEKSLPCRNQGYTNPSNCLECLCPSGFAGKLCDRMPVNTTLLEAKRYWQTFNSTNTDLDKDKFYHHRKYFWIKAPLTNRKRKTLQVQILKMKDAGRCETCNGEGVEIKYLNDPRAVSPIICCPTYQNGLWNRTISSTNNPLIVEHYIRAEINSFEFRYRYYD